MLHERIYLDPTDDRVYIDTYVANRRTFKRDAMLVIPGGGYTQVCTEREGEPIALAFLAKGFNCFVLNYRVLGDRYPSQLIDASRAILYIKEHAEDFCIDPERVFCLGFSAGGHLAGCLATMHSDPEVLSTLGIEKGMNKPRGAVLCYPVVSANVPTHGNSFLWLTGKNPEDMTEEEKQKYSLESNVTEDSSDMFIWHTSRDTLVPMVGSLRLAESYWRIGRPVALRIYPYGEHGAALSNKITGEADFSRVQSMVEEWVDYACEWVDSLK